jgi:hypothetical protein
MVLFILPGYWCICMRITFRITLSALRYMFGCLFRFGKGMVWKSSARSVIRITKFSRQRLLVEINYSHAAFSLPPKPQVESHD